MQDTKQKYYQKIYRADKRAEYAITVGGYGIIASILAILIFLVYQSLPLGEEAEISDLFSFPVQDTEKQTVLTGVDPYMEVMYTVDQQGLVQFYRMVDKALLLEEKLPLVGTEKILSAQKGSLQKHIFAVGTDSGRVMTAEIEMEPEYRDEGRIIVPSFELIENWQFDAENDSIPNHIEKIAFVQNEDWMRFWVWEDHEGKLHCRIYDADEEEDYLHNIGEYFQDESIASLTISYSGENLILGSEAGKVYWFKLDDYEEVKLQDKWKASESPISAVSYLIGDQAVVIGDTEGEVGVWFPVRTPSNWLKFTKVHSFEPHTAAVKLIAGSARNRDFLTVDAKGNSALHYSTTGKTQLKFEPSGHPIQTADFSPKANGLVMVDNRQHFALFQLDNPHPETTADGLFGRVWYEGYTQPEFVWQSTGGSDEFEPKLSLIPIIFGTLKGTLYAMIFSIPIALLAAIYVSQFAPGWMARIIKPTVEIMAALPSVVIGFLAGLYFSPVFETYLMGFLSLPIFLPIVFVLSIISWRAVPETTRARIKPGQELLFMLPIGIIAFYISMLLGPAIESWFFNGNIQQWLYMEMGMTYETRNSIVVGFALGFAVIPIIFTMAEDALTNVPESLSSASLALGASRWQTVRRVILPAASGGIFAAIMLGLGRAVGETMIVLMATGNTPILDLNPFNGFRAMSACIAVEIPEAPVGGTLYRVLFMTALLLFLFTFVLNTVSSLIGDRLRKKYARF